MQKEAANTQSRPRPNNVREFIHLYRPCRRAVMGSLRYKSSMHDAWEKSKNGDWLVWILDCLAIPHPETKSMRADAMKSARGGAGTAKRRAGHDGRARAHAALLDMIAVRRADAKTADPDPADAARQKALEDYAKRIRKAIPNPFAR